MLTTVERGRIAEDLAAGFLTLAGYHVTARNFRYSRFEVDLIIRRENLAILVEVKYRKGNHAGGAAASVTLEKQRRLETAAVGYLKLHQGENLKVRFDVVLIEEDSRGKRLTIRHIPGAFRASGRYRI